LYYYLAGHAETSRASWTASAKGCKGSAIFTLKIVDCMPVLAKPPSKPRTVAPR
jgi:hypothetical protein